MYEDTRFRGKRPVLLYLYAEPERGPDGRPVPRAEINAHRAETTRFAEIVTGDEVVFHSCSYGALLPAWSAGPSVSARAHAGALVAQFLV